MAPGTGIPLARPSTGDEELEELRSVLRSGQVSQGSKVQEFESLVADLVGTRYAFATTSCTTAMHLALVAVGIGPGDEVLVPDFTFPATANVVVQQGATPVLVDIDLRTYNLAPEKLKAHVTPKTKAIMPVHLFGLAADMDAVLDFARDHELAVIEDAACALGATYAGQPCGSFGDVGCFSFHARKVITTGEGGMIVTNRDDLADRIRLLRSHGGVRMTNGFRFEDAGYNYRLSDLQAAVGVAQIHRLSALISRRRELARQLRELLADVPGIRAPEDLSQGEHIYQAFVGMLAPDIDRDEVVLQLSDRGIGSTLGTYALHDQPFFQKEFGYASGQLPASHAAFLHTLALPLYPDMTEENVVTVVHTLADVLSDARAQ
jgi:perosamine synthetase